MNGLIFITALFALCHCFLAIGQGENPLRSDWNRHHSSAESDAMLKAWHKKWPRLTKLHLIGETRKGSPMWVLEPTDHSTGKAEEKLAYDYDGNIHSEELPSKHEDPGCWISSFSSFI